MLAFLCSACEIPQTELKCKLLFHLQARYESTSHSCRESQCDIETLDMSIAWKTQKVVIRPEHFVL